jgi:hypothetical protein
VAATLEIVLVGISNHERDTGDGVKVSVKEPLKLKETLEAVVDDGEEVAEVWLPDVATEVELDVRDTVLMELFEAVWLVVGGVDVAELERVVPDVLLVVLTAVLDKILLNEAVLDEILLDDIVLLLNDPVLWTELELLEPVPKRMLELLLELPVTRRMLELVPENDDAEVVSLGNLGKGAFEGITGGCTIPEATHS